MNQGINARQRGLRWGNKWGSTYESRSFLDYLQAGWKCSRRAYKTEEKRAQFRIGWLEAGYRIFKHSIAM